MTEKRISHYQIVEQMGAGGMGVVYRARDPRLDRLVAIKVLTAHTAADPTAQARFVQEAKTASALDHPNICTIYEIDETPEGQLFIVMAHYEGRALDSMLSDGPLPVRDGVAIAMQVADGLGRAHGKSIVHRDVKSANVILTNDGVAKILDFGLAKIAGAVSLTQTGHAVGSPGYMSPEQVTGKPVDHRTDIWSLGVMLHELLTGKLPFKGEHAQALMYWIVNQDPALLSDSMEDVPEGLQEIISRCLAKDPDERYQDMTQVRRDLRAVLLEVPEDGSQRIHIPDASTSAIAAALQSGARPRSNLARRLRFPIALIALALMVAGGVWGARTLMRLNPPTATRVLVLPPEVTGATAQDSVMLTTNVQVALMRTLIALRGIDPVQPRGAIDPADLATEIDAAAADEVLVSRVQQAGGQLEIQLQRQDPSGAALWTEPFSSPVDEPVVLAGATQAHILFGYPDHRSSTSTDLLEVAKPDYERYLRAQHAYSTTGSRIPILESLADSLKMIQQGSPQFPDAYTLEATICDYIFQLSREPRWLDRARASIDVGAGRFPDDIRFERNRFRLLLSAGAFEEAQTVFENLRRRDPGSVETSHLESLLAEQSGDLARAADIMAGVVQRTNTRGYQIRLANLEYRLGRYDECRDRLQRITTRFPAHVWARSKLAELELLYGQPEAAEALYEALIEEAPNVARIVNLGLARELLGKYDAAALDFRRALDATPNDPYSMLNLADCEKMRGHNASADSLYRGVITLLEADPDADSWVNQLILAQCFAHLGRAQEAVGAAQQGMTKAQGAPDALYMASLVYAVVGEKASALVNASQAVDKGVQARWFHLPLFDSLRGDTEFQRILALDRITTL